MNYSTIPLGQNPNGDPPNFNDPPNLINTVRAVGVTMALITMILLCLRLIIIRRSERNFGLDDASAIVAFTLGCAYTGISCSLDNVSRHSWDTPLSAIDPSYLKKLFVTSVFCGPMLFFSKSSILLLYHAAFHSQRWLRISVYALLVILFCSYWMTVPLCFNYCMPHKGNPWDLSVLSNCNHLATPGLVHAAANIVTDIAITVLPLPIIVKLKIPTGNKIALACVFATGLVALGASGLTVYYRVQIIRGVDATWASAQTYICIQAEVYASISVACMPLLARLMRVKFSDTKLYQVVFQVWSRLKGTMSSWREETNHSKHGSEMNDCIHPHLDSSEVQPCQVDPQIYSSRMFKENVVAQPGSVIIVHEEV